MIHTFHTYSHLNYLQDGAGRDKVEHRNEERELEHQCGALEADPQGLERGPSTLAAHTFGLKDGRVVREGGQLLMGRTRKDTFAWGMIPLQVIADLDPYIHIGSGSSRGSSHLEAAVLEHQQGGRRIARNTATAAAAGRPVRGNGVAPRRPWGRSGGPVRRLFPVASAAIPSPSSRRRRPAKGRGGR